MKFFQSIYYETNTLAKMINTSKIEYIWGISAIYNLTQSFICDSGAKSLSSKDGQMNIFFQKIISDI